MIRYISSVRIKEGLNYKVLHSILWDRNMLIDNFINSLWRGYECKRG